MEPTPLVILPETDRTGPAAAATRPKPMTACCVPSSISLKDCAAPPTALATSVTAGASALPTWMEAVSIAPFISSMLRLVSPIWESARRWAAVWSFVAAVYRWMPSVPWFIITKAAREASAPNIVCIAASRVAESRPPSLA